MDIMKKILSVLMVLFVSFRLNAQWVQTDLHSSDQLLSLAVSGTNIFATTYSGVYLSTNGTNWTQIGLTNINDYSLAVSGNNIIAGTSSGVYLSSNDGANWTSVDTALMKHNVYSLAVSGKNVIAGTGMKLFYEGEIFLSTNSGTSWSMVSTDLAGNWIRTLAVSGTNLFAGTSFGYQWPGHGVFLSTNNGTSWTRVNNGLTDTSIIALAVSDTKLFAGTLSGVFLSTNNGTNWNSVNNGLTNPHISSLAFSQNPAGGMNLFAGTFDYYVNTTNSGVFLSTNNGASWNKVNYGLTDTSVIALAVCGANLFAATISGVYRRPLSEMITRVESGQHLTLQYSLEQNYPNPFNPSTVIKYAIPFESKVSIRFYNSLGQIVREVNAGNRQLGSYEINFNSSGLASGIYFYSIKAFSTDGKNDFNTVKKMILLK
jgi:hypothetical protein